VGESLHHQATRRFEMQEQRNQASLNWSLAAVLHLMTPHPLHCVSRIEHAPK